MSISSFGSNPGQARWSSNRVADREAGVRIRVERTRDERRDEMRLPPLGQCCGELQSSVVAPVRLKKDDEILGKHARETQCENRTGSCAVSSSSLVAPPSIHSRSRECPYPPAISSWAPRSAACVSS